MKKILLIAAMALSAIGFSQIPPNVPANGLVGYWPFSGNANDHGLNLNHGSVSGAALVSDRFGNANSAYSFNGSSDYIMVPDHPTLSGFNDMSISLWINMALLPNGMGYKTMLAKWFYASGCGGNIDTYEICLDNSQLMVASNNNNMTGYAAPQPFTNADVNIWKHVVFVSNSVTGQQRIYINGVFTASVSLPGTICNSTNPVFFGSATASTRHFSGKLDDIGIWNRVLTNCEIGQLYSPTTTTLSSLPSQTICAGSPVLLTAAAGSNSYAWSTGATTSVIAVSPVSSTHYTVTNTNTVNCSSTQQTVSVVVNPLPVLSIAPSANTVCAFSTVTLSVSGAASYAWAHNGSINSTLNVTPGITTVYSVTGTGANGCMNTATVGITVKNCGSVGINSTSFTENTIQLYPNPGSNFLNIRFETMPVNYTASFTDITGKQLLHQTLNNTDTEQQLNIHSFANGVYFLTITTDKGTKIKTEKIIVNH